MSEREGSFVDGVVKCRGRREIEDATVTGENGDANFLTLDANYYLLLASGDESTRGT